MDMWTPARYHCPGKVTESGLVWEREAQLTTPTTTYTCFLCHVSIFNAMKLYWFLKAKLVRIKKKKLPLCS